MASLFQRGKRFYVRVYVDGRARDISTGTTNRKLAEKFRRKLEYEHAAGIVETETQTPLGDLITQFVEHLRTRHPTKSAANDLSKLRQLFGQIVPALEVKGASKPAKASVLAVKYAEQVTPQLINRRLDERAHTVCPNTLNGEREILHRLFAYAIEFHGMTHPDPRWPNPVAAVKRRRVPAPQIRFLNAEQIDRQLAVLEKHPSIQTAVATMIFAGVRRSEALWLTRSDLDRENELIRIRAKTIDGTAWQPKTGTNRTVPINTDMATILDSYHPMRATAWLFPSPEGCRYDPDNFSHALAMINKRAGLTWTCLHFRHTFGSLLAQRGVSLYKISAMMGNSPEICRRHYAALIPDDFAGDAEFHLKPQQPVGMMETA